MTKFIMFPPPPFIRHSRVCIVNRGVHCGRIAHICVFDGRTAFLLTTSLNEQLSLLSNPLYWTCPLGETDMEISSY